MLLSIIIPCYNAEKYIENCLKSLVENSGGILSAFEIIAINDGSTDNTLEILESFAKKFDTIKVINQNNMGSSVARNKGMENSSGEYIWFIDADDYILANTLEQIISLLIENRPEIIVFQNINRVREDSIFNKIESVGLLKKEFVISDKTACCVYGAVFKNHKNIKFLDELTYAEDIYFNYLQYLFLEKREKGCILVDTPVYCYRNNPNSLMRRKDITAINKHTRDLFYLAYLYKKHISSGEIDSEVKLENTKLRQYGSIQGALTLLPKSSLNKNKVFKELKNNGLYPYPRITWTISGAKNLKRKIIEIIKGCYRYRLAYDIYYFIVRLINKTG